MPITVHFCIFNLRINMTLIGGGGVVQDDNKQT